MRYSELMLLEDNVTNYLLESYMQKIVDSLDNVSPLYENTVIDNDIVMERNRSGIEIMRDIDKIGLDDGAQMTGDYLLGAKRDIKNARKKYDHDVLMRSLSYYFGAIGAGTAIVGKITNGKLATALGGAIAVVGLLSRIKFTDKKIAKDAKKYASELYKFRDRVNDLNDTLENTELPPDFANDRRKVAAFDQCRKQVTTLKYKMDRLIRDLDEDPVIRTTTHGQYKQ